MAKFLKTWLGLVTTGLLLLIAMCYTICFASNDTTNWLSHTIQEIVCFLAVATGLIWVVKQSYYERMGLMRKLRLVSGFIILAWGLIRLLASTYPLEIYFDSDEFGSGIILLAFEVIFITLICFQLLSLLKALVFIQPGRGTARNFQALIFILFLMTLSAFIPNESTDNWEFERYLPFYGSPLHVIAQSLLAFMAFIIGFRCSWMHYLNRQKKIMTTLSGLVLLALMIPLFPVLPGIAIQYSVILFTFIRSTLVILLIYGGMSVFGLILQLPSAGLMDRRMQDIRSLQQISATIGTVYNREDLLLKTTELALQILHGDFTWIELKKQDTFQLAATSGIDPEQIKKMDREIIQLRKVAMDKDEVLMIHDIQRSRFFRHRTIRDFSGGSLLAALLKFKHEVIGFIVVGRQNPFGFVDESRGLFRAFCDQVAVALENARLVEISIEREVYKEELRVAHQAQMRLLPQKVPQRKALDVDGFCLTANDIGGDFYDYIEVSDQRLDIVIGDVSGKGAAAAFYMAELKGVLQSLAPHFNSPKAMLVQINDFLRNHMESNMFVTMIYMIFNFDKKQVLLARAGHEPLCHFHDQEIRWIEKKGIGLGLTSHEQFADVMEEEALHLSTGDGLFLYTDGLIEVRNGQEEEFGHARLDNLMNQVGHLSAREANRTIQRAIRKFCGNESQQDDMTAVMIRYHGQ